MGDAVACEDIGEQLGAHPALIVDRHDLLLGAADSEQPQRAGQRHVALLPDDDAERGRAREAFLAQVVANALVKGLARRRERGDVGHLTARDEREGRLRRQAEQLEHPAPGDRLERRDGRCRLGEAGVLVPRGDEPVGSEGCRQRAADHEAEVAARAHCGETRLGGGRELVDERERVRALVGDGAVNGLQHRRVVRVRPDRAGRERVDVVGGELCGSAKECSLVGHGARVRQA